MDQAVFHWPVVELLKFRSSSTWESRHAMIMVHTLKLLIATASERHRLLIYSFVLLSSDHIHHWRVPNNWTVLWFCSGNWSNQCLGVDVNECWLTIMMWSADGESSTLQHKRFAKSNVCGFMVQKDLTKCINVFLLSGRCVPLRDDTTCLMCLKSIVGLVRIALAQCPKWPKSSA